MISFIPKTRTQWIATIVLAIGVILFLYIFTPTFRGHAVEISVENAGQTPIFVYIDNTGRHGVDTPVEKLKTTSETETPAGLLIQANTTRSFGTAVGLGDSPTLHILPITEGGIADLSRINDCPFDTISFQKLAIPSLHVRIKWTGTRCEKEAS